MHSGNVVSIHASTKGYNTPVYVLNTYIRHLPWGLRYHDTAKGVVQGQCSAGANHGCTWQW